MQHGIPAMAQSGGNAEIMKSKVLPVTRQIVVNVKIRQELMYLI